MHISVSTADVFAVLYLVFLEGVLSVDNALALASLVRGRLSSEADRKKALRYGIIGAYAFRIVVVFAGVWLMQHEWVKWVAASYLIYLSVKELFFKKDMEDETGGTTGAQVRWLPSFMSTPLVQTVIAVELMDIAFSIDSIAVALSVSQKAWVLIAGAVLGILAMRFAAQGFIALIERVPILEKTAFVLVLVAGLKIVAELLGYEIPELWFIAGMFGIIGLSVVVGLLGKKKAPKPSFHSEDKKEPGESEYPRFNALDIDECCYPTPRNPKGQLS